MKVFLLATLFTILVITEYQVENKCPRCPKKLSHQIAIL